jgi:hypothetical protein
LYAKLSPKQVADVLAQPRRKMELSRLAEADPGESR